MSNDAMREALRWYEQQVRDCRKISSDGVIARQALDNDGGLRARAALAAPGAASAHPVDGYKDLYVALHKTLGPAIDYVQSHQSEFGIGLGEDTIPHIVKAFLDSRAPAGNGGDAERDSLLAALLRYTEGFYGSAIKHGMPAGTTANAVAHVESAARRLHALAARHAPTGADAQLAQRYQWIITRPWFESALKRYLGSKVEIEDVRQTEVLIDAAIALLAKRGTA